MLEPDLRERRADSRGDDAVVGRAGRMAEHAVAEDEAQPVRPHRRQQLLRLFVQRLQALDRDDTPRHFGEQGGLVAAAGADFQNRTETAETPRVRTAEQQLDHSRHHRRLGDRLAVTDRQAGVFVGLGCERRVDEQMPGHRSESGQHPRLDDAALAQALRHALAYVGRIEAETDRAVAPAGIGMSRGEIALRPQDGALRSAGRTGDAIELQRKLEARTIVRRHQPALPAHSRQPGRLA